MVPDELDLGWNQRHVFCPWVDYGGHVVEAYSVSNSPLRRVVRWVSSSVVGVVSLPDEVPPASARGVLPHDILVLVSEGEIDPPMDLVGMVPAATEVARIQRRVPPSVLVEPPVLRVVVAD